MATPIATKNLGTDDGTGLEKQLQVWHVNIDAKAETVDIRYDIALLSPNGKVASVAESKNILRYNRPTKYYEVGEIITPAVMDGETEVTPAVISDGTEVKQAGNMRFDELRNSEVGIIIDTMVEAIIAEYPNVEQL